MFAMRRGEGEAREGGDVSPLPPRPKEGDKTMMVGNRYATLNALAFNDWQDWRSDTDVADLLGITTRTLRNWRGGISRVQPSIQRKLIILTGIGFGDLFLPRRKQNDR